jgi:hypothetical protein
MTKPDDDAIKGFFLETLRQACSDFLRLREYKAVAFFLHNAGESKRTLSSVDVAQAFRGKGFNVQCAHYLRTVATEKQVRGEKKNKKNKGFKQVCALLAHSRH